MILTLVTQPLLQRRYVPVSNSNSSLEYCLISTLLNLPNLHPQGNTALNGIVTVGATDENDNTVSNIGECVDLFAPGADVPAAGSFVCLFVC